MVHLAGIDEFVALAPADVQAVPLVAIERESGNRQRLAPRAGLLDPVVATLQSQSLLSALFRHEQTVYAQASQSAACMAAHQVEARLCRWLLRARDLAGTDDLQFTQEFLAEMLGVKRFSAHSLCMSARGRRVGRWLD